MYAGDEIGKEWSWREVCYGFGKGHEGISEAQKSKGEGVEHYNRVYLQKKN